MSKLIEYREQLQALIFQLETQESLFLAAREFNGRLAAGEREFTTDDVGLVLQLADRALALPVPTAADLANIVSTAAALQSDAIRETWDQIVTVGLQAQAHLAAAAAQAVQLTEAAAPPAVNTNDAR